MIEENSEDLPAITNDFLFHLPNPYLSQGRDRIGKGWWKSKKSFVVFLELYVFSSFQKEEEN